MKNIISIFIVLFLFLVVCGCTQSTDSGNFGDQTHNEPNYAIFDTAHAEDVYTGCPPAPIAIWLADTANGDFRTAIVDEISTSRTLDEEQHRNFGNYNAHKISDIKEFHYPPVINGFELFCVTIGESAYIYYYSPPSDRPKIAGQYHFSPDTGIQIAIERPEARLFEGTVTEHLREIARVNNMTFTEDGFVYSDCNTALNRIEGQIGDTIFIIRTPKSFDYNRLHSLARDLISSAELVNVDEEIARLGQ
jgi:hypothetical protein